ncbi:MAG: response regulator [Rectinemataceae bacterium]
MEPDQKTLLLVEDEVIIALAEKAALTREGYAVMHARSGEEAVDTVKSRLGSTIDLILMDIDLGGGIDGTRAAPPPAETRSETRSWSGVIPYRAEH